MAESMDTGTGTDTERQPPYYSNTRVFWDVVDFPVPLDGDLDLFCFEVSGAISNERFSGEVEFYAYGDDLTDQDRMAIRKAGIWLLQEGFEAERL
uniref:Uncharacterized protein n=1 Tax=Noccaea caerulescens TaxID=107243 RepID=A0A1J3FZJ8_NOCCA